MLIGNVSKKEHDNHRQLKAIALILLILPLMLAACGEGTSAVPQGLQGPALIMFYTDN